MRGETIGHSNGARLVADRARKVAKPGRSPCALRRFAPASPASRLDSARRRRHLSASRFCAPSRGPCGAFLELPYFCLALAGFWPTRCRSRGDVVIERCGACGKLASGFAILELPEIKISAAKLPVGVRGQQPRALLFGFAAAAAAASCSLCASESRFRGERYRKIGHADRLSFAGLFSSFASVARASCAFQALVCSWRGPERNWDRPG